MFRVFLQKAKIKEESGKLNDAIADYSKALDYEYVHAIELANEYTTRRLFGIPKHIQSMMAYKILIYYLFIYLKRFS